MLDSQSNQVIYKIVITGGPCAGKTTSLKRITDAFTPKGYMVLSVDETATQLFKSGAPCRKTGDKKEYQYQLAKLMIAKEDAIYGIAKTFTKADKVLIVCDRGALDNRVYVDKQEFDYILDKLETNEDKLRNRYNAVFHLVTAANGAEKHYTTRGNKHRLETPEEAILLDTKLINAWNGHPHIRVVDNKTSFNKKMQLLINEIAYFLGEPKPVEERRKYLIELPDLKQLEERSNCRRVDIRQAYLKSKSEEIIRLRDREFKGNHTYYITHIRTVGGRRMQTEESLTEQQYLDLLNNQIDMDYEIINKQRFYLSENGLYYSIDVFPQWMNQNQALMEIEVYNTRNKIRIPEGIHVIEDVSEKIEYTNPYIARKKK